MNTKINEYVHEAFCWQSGDGESFLFLYEPLENVGAVNIAVEVVHAVYGEICRFYLHEANADMDSLQQHRSRAKFVPMRAIMNPSSVIKILWDKYPGEHYLRVSYDFPEVGEVVLDKNEQPHNWTKEGF